MAKRVGGLTAMDTDAITNTELRDELDAYPGKARAWAWHDDRGQTFCVVAFDCGRIGVETSGDCEWYDGTEPAIDHGRYVGTDAADAVDAFLRGEFEA